jgi:3-hydroxybutyryl-CoA dehydrogenase
MPPDVPASPRPSRQGAVGIIGAGLMGSGIAQVVLEAGDAVRLHDPDPSALARARERVRDGLTKRATRLHQTDEARRTWVADRLERLVVAGSLAEAAIDAAIVIEAAVEDLAAKRAIFGALADATSSTAILATNTSALRVSDIAHGAGAHAGRVLGLHWFNPAPLMALVEVVPGEQTDAAVLDSAIDAVRHWGKTPVRSADTPGFIVNRVNRPFTIEALRLLEAAQADVLTIDEAMRAAGFPMGPFELMDLAGLDVNLAAATGVWDGLGRPERLRPSPIQEGMVAAGRLGRKSGEGFYRYDEAGRRGEPAVERGAPDGQTMDADRIAARITAAIDAEADLAVADGVATREDIDLALRLGAGHPLRSTP